MNLNRNIYEVEERLDEIRWHIRELQRGMQSEVPRENLSDVISDIGYQAGQIEQLSREMERNLQ